MTQVNLPPEVIQQVKEREFRQRYNPEETERVEGNLRLTKTRQLVPGAAHQRPDHRERNQPTR